MRDFQARESPINGAQLLLWPRGTLGLSLIDEANNLPVECTGVDELGAGMRKRLKFSGKIIKVVKCGVDKGNTGGGNQNDNQAPFVADKLVNNPEFTNPGKGIAVAEDNNDITGLKVMVIDDSKTIRRTAETLLKKAGCEVITATDGFEALSVIADSRPDIIFVDIMMPRLDGYQTCALIKNNKDFKKTPVIMLSSKDSLFDRARGRVVGSDQYLTKPFTKDELLGAIREFSVNA